MIEWFKNGKTLPRRFVWEIILGAYDLFAKGESLVDVTLNEGETLDVIGDVHGEWLNLSINSTLLGFLGAPSSARVTACQS